MEWVRDLWLLVVSLRFVTLMKSCCSDTVPGCFEAPTRKKAVVLSPQPPGENVMNHGTGITTLLHSKQCLKCYRQHWVGYDLKDCWIVGGCSSQPPAVDDKVWFRSYMQTLCFLFLCALQSVRSMGVILMVRSRKSLGPLSNLAAPVEHTHRCDQCNLELGIEQLYYL